MDSLKFLTRSAIEKIENLCATPVYVYDERTLRNQAAAALDFPNAFGLTVRYAMKACPNAAILRLFQACGLYLDASSGHEARRAIRAGFMPDQISLSTQELPGDFEELVRQGVTINACSLSQIERFGEAFPGARLGLRINPGLGSGGTTKTNVGGPSSSFGIWHEHFEAVEAALAHHGLEVFRIHTHIGSGSDPDIWLRVADMSMDFVERFPSATILNLGGGFKVGRTAAETSTDLQLIGTPVRTLFESFAKRTGRKIHLEIEPGTFLMANAGAIVSRIQDITDTGGGGYAFLKLDTGMTEILRPGLYGSHHPMIVVPRNPDRPPGAAEYIATGHCCESGDMLTCEAGNPDTLEPRRMAEARIDDWLVIEGTGAYCSAMSAINYNSFPQAAEVLLREDGEPALIRRRQSLDQVVANEILLDF